MTPEQRDRRRRIMDRSIALGHCICDPRKPCPCDLFKARNVCECAGERLPVPAGPVRLTETVRNPGCASKISKGDLTAVLAGLPEIDDERVIVGRSAGDDAGVIRFGDGQALILTVDVFAPSVDDPYTFGRIAAANSLSDIYAMGATPLSALSIIGFPIHTLPRETMHEILRGGIDTMAEAGVSVIGGHSINDEEVKCGFAVVGAAGEGDYVKNTGAQPGDAIVLTKPLGVGIVAFARQINRVDDSATEEIAVSMSTLNRVAGESLRRFGAHAATDVTGFSLMGHLGEIVKHSNVLAEIDFDALPLFIPVQELARADVIPGGVERNREALPEALLDFCDCTDAQQAVLFCPETSGGILAILPDDQADAYIDHLQANGVAHATRVGRIAEAHDGGRIRIQTRSAGKWNTTRKATAAPSPSKPAKSEENACCASPPIDGTPNAEPLACCSGGAGGGDMPAPTPNATAGTFLAPVPAATAEAFKAFSAAANAPGAIDKKAKKLMALALSVVTKCAPCVKINTLACREAGATDEEIGEAVGLGIAFGGASVTMFYETLRREHD